MKSTPYVALEGPDGSGKDSQADLLCDWFREQGLDPLRLNEPDATLPTGQLLRQMLKDGTYVKAHAAMFLADRMAMLSERVTPALKAGRPVVCARSFLSTLVYQQESWPLDWLFAIHEMLPERPTHIFILDIPPEAGLERTRKRAGHAEFYEKVEVLARVRQRYLDIIDSDRLATMLGPGTDRAVVNADRPIDAIQADLRRELT